MIRFGSLALAVPVFFSLVTALLRNPEGRIVNAGRMIYTSSQADYADERISFQSEKVHVEIRPFRRVRCERGQTLMKTICVLTAALLIAWSDGYAQLILKAGNSFTYRFDSLPFQHNATFGIAEPSGALFAYIDPWDPSSLGPTNSYRIELFEDTPAGVPILSRTITSASSIFDTDYRMANAWGDLQGSFRVTAVSGFITLNGFSLQAFKAAVTGGFDVYGTDRIFLPAPPVLSFVRSNAFVTVQWPKAATNFILEASSSMGPLGPWEAVTNAVVSSSNVFSATLTLDEPRRFFRLKGSL